MGSVNQPRRSRERQRAAAGALVNCVPCSCMSAEYILMVAQSPLVSILPEHNYLQFSAHRERSFCISHPQTFLSLVF